MELIAGGLLCRGRVTGIHGYGFDAGCCTSDGSCCDVQGRWQPARAHSSKAA